MYSYSNVSIRNLQRTHLTDQISSFCILANTSKYASRTVRRPLPGEADREEEKEKLAALRAEEEARLEGQKEQEAEAETRKRKLEDLESKKRALEEATRKKQKELEDEAKRIRAVEEAEKQAKELRERNEASQKRIAVPMEKEEDFFTRKSKELVSHIVKNTAETAKEAQNAKDAYQESCKILEMDQGKFIKASKELQGSIGEGSGLWRSNCGGEDVCLRQPECHSAE